MYSDYIVQQDNMIRPQTSHSLDPQEVRDIHACIKNIKSVQADFTKSPQLIDQPLDVDKFTNTVFRP